MPAGIGGATPGPAAWRTCVRSRADYTPRRERGQRRGCAGSASGLLTDRIVTRQSKVMPTADDRRRALDALLEQLQTKVLDPVKGAWTSELKLAAKSVTDVWPDKIAQASTTLLQRFAAYRSKVEVDPVALDRAGAFAAVIDTARALGQMLGQTSEALTGAKSYKSEKEKDTIDGARGTIDGASVALVAWSGDLSRFDASIDRVEVEPLRPIVERPAVFTVCLSGTACTRDEGEVTRPASDRTIYDPLTGYIPVRIHTEISGDLRATTPSVSVRGVGENDWANDDVSEPLVLDGPLLVDESLTSYCAKYSGGNQYSKVDQADGFPLPALALHAANLAARSGARTINLVGHSRGAVSAIMAAWFLYAYGSPEVRRIPVNIFAIDPVPGPGRWYSIITQLAPNVARYVGVYAWDMCLPLDKPFQAVVPRPNGRMTGEENDVEIPAYPYWPWNRWKHLAYESQKRDPLAPGHGPQPLDYELFACRGRHGTVAGNATSDGAYDPAKVSDEVKPVPELVYRMARGYLTQWGVTFPRASAVVDTGLALRRRLNTDHRLFDAMGGGATRTSMLAGRPYVRRVSSIMGPNPYNTYYMDDVVGDPPYTMAYPVTNERSNAGWVRWTFL